MQDEMPLQQGFLDHFDFLYSDRMGAEVTSPYTGYRILDVVSQPVPPAVFNKSLSLLPQPIAPVLWVASNCNSYNAREVYIRELMNYIPVDSYGKCLNNKEFPQNLSKIELMRQGYRFYLAFENSNCKDCICEKTYQVLYAGIVPVVYGPRDYSGFLPHRDAAIYMDGFGSPKELAEYLLKLTHDDKLYMKHLQFKVDKKVDVDFIKRFRRNETLGKYYWCGACRLIAETQMSQFQRKPERLKGDTSCRPKYSIKGFLNRSDDV